MNLGVAKINLSSFFIMLSTYWTVVNNEKYCSQAANKKQARRSAYLECSCVRSAVQYIISVFFCALKC